MTSVPDSTPPLQATHRPRRLRLLAGPLLVGLVFAAGCGKPAPATLQDAGTTPAELRAMLADPAPEVQARGALGLSRLGADARDAVPELLPLLKSPAPLVRQNAALALGAAGADAAVPALKRLESDPQKPVRDAAKQARDKIGG